MKHKLWNGSLTTIATSLLKKILTTLFLLDIYRIWHKTKYAETSLIYFIFKCNKLHKQCVELVIILNPVQHGVHIEAGGSVFW